MYNLEKSPGMFSDRPGITPKSLDLVVSPTCLREKERELFDVVCGLVEGSERDIQYKSSLADPTFLSNRGLSAVLWRTVRSIFLRLTTSLQSLWWTILMNGGLSAPYPRTVRSTKFQSAQKFANFLNSNSNLGSLLI